MSFLHKHFQTWITIHKKKPRSGSAQFWVITNERDSRDKIRECFLLLSLRSLQSPWDFYKWPHKGHQGSQHFPNTGKKIIRAKHGTGNARIPSQRITGVCHLETKGKAIAEKQLHCVTEDTGCPALKGQRPPLLHLHTHSRRTLNRRKIMHTHTRVCLVWTNNLLSGESI